MCCNEMHLEFERSSPLSDTKVSIDLNSGHLSAQVKHSLPPTSNVLRSHPYFSHGQAKVVVGV